MSPKAEKIISKLKSQSNPDNVAGMARFGINPETALGIKIPVLRQLARQYKKDHELALELWGSGLHDVRILASMIGDPAELTEEQMDRWVKDFNSWDLCDQVIMNLFGRRKDLADKKIGEWSENESEFIRRAGIVLIARNAVHFKGENDDYFLAYFPLLKKYATDPRNFVKKAVNWAIRQIGKRNLNLNEKAVLLCRELEAMENKSAGWIARDAIRELTDEKTLKRVREKSR